MGLKTQKYSDNKFIKTLYIVYFSYFKRLKIPRRRLRIGSSPISGTKKMGVINAITPIFDAKNVNWGGEKMDVWGLFLHKIV